MKKTEDISRHLKTDEQVIRVDECSEESRSKDAAKQKLLALFLLVPACGYYLYRSGNNLISLFQTGRIFERPFLVLFTVLIAAWFVWVIFRLTGSRRTHKIDRGHKSLVLTSDRLLSVDRDGELIDHIELAAINSLKVSNMHDTPNVLIVTPKRMLTQQQFLFPFLPDPTAATKAIQEAIGALSK